MGDDAFAMDIDGVLEDIHRMFTASGDEEEADDDGRTRSYSAGENRTSWEPRLKSQSFSGGGERIISPRKRRRGPAGGNAAGSKPRTAHKPRRRHKRGNYACSKCGMPKKNHVCKFVHQVMAVTVATQCALDPEATIARMKEDEEIDAECRRLERECERLGIDTTPQAEANTTAMDIDAESKTSTARAPAPASSPSASRGAAGQLAVLSVAEMHWFVESFFTHADPERVCDVPALVHTYGEKQPKLWARLAAQYSTFRAPVAAPMDLHVTAMDTDMSSLLEDGGSTSSGSDDIDEELPILQLPMGDPILPLSKGSASASPKWLAARAARAAPVPPAPGSWGGPPVMPPMVEVDVPDFVFLGSQGAGARRTSRRAKRRTTKAAKLLNSVAKALGKKEQRKRAARKLKKAAAKALNLQLKPSKKRERGRETAGRKSVRRSKRSRAAPTLGMAFAQAQEQEMVTVTVPSGWSQEGLESHPACLPSSSSSPTLGPPQLNPALATAPGPANMFQPAPRMAPMPTFGMPSAPASGPGVEFVPAADVAIGTAVLEAAKTGNPSAKAYCAWRNETVMDSLTSQLERERKEALRPRSRRRCSSDPTYDSKFNPLPPGLDNLDLGSLVGIGPEKRKKGERLRRWGIRRGEKIGSKMQKSAAKWLSILFSPN